MAALLAAWVPVQPDPHHGQASPRRLTWFLWNRLKSADATPSQACARVSPWLEAPASETFP